ncbi:MAG: hypothetical protein MJ092_06270, partial [Lachnospiraceae bacterium]|nr:hypothetical protein [Lachnospiraceae bacterium]
VTGNASHNVQWSISGNHSNNTKISSNGLLTVAADEPAGTITVTATSAFDSTKKDTASVNVEVPLVISSVTVTPKNQTVLTGETLQFSAIVTGTADHGVIWSISGNNSSNTTIDEDGILTVDEAEIAQEIQVTATSVFDPDTAASVIVFVQQPEPVHIHTLIYHEAVSANCMEAGNDGYYICEECGLYFSDETANNIIDEGSWVIEAKGHRWSDSYTVITAATYLHNGEKCILCRECGEVKENSYVSIPKKVVQNGWACEDGLWMYFENGVMQTGWIRPGTKWYYLDANGIMLTGLQNINGTRYYFDEDGAMLIDWIAADGNWYYALSSGAIQTGWVKVGNTWYFMDSNGVMQTGFISDAGSVYYLSGSGAMQTGWIAVNGYWYYASSSGVIQTGWLPLGNNWYYLNADGSMQIGWKDINGHRFYFEANGAMHVGWLEINGTWYYYNSSGYEARGWMYINGKDYHFDENDGRCYNPY